jgi:hypothetical protein
MTTFWCEPVSVSATKRCYLLRNLDIDIKPARFVLLYCNFILFFHRPQQVSDDDFAFLYPNLLPFAIWVDTEGVGLGAIYFLYLQRDKFILLKQ